MPAKSTLITGATGRVGGAALLALVAEGHEPMALVRSPERAEALPVEVPVRVGDLSDPESLREAFRSVDRLLISSGHDPGMAVAQANAVAAAAAAGVGRVVKISGSPASSFEGTPSAVVRQHLEVEDALAGTSIEHTNIRPNAFAQLLAGYAGEIANGRLPLALGDKKLSWVDVRDVGAVAAAALVAESALPRTIDVTGPEGLSGAELAAIVGEFTGTTVEYVPISDDESRERVRAVGAPDWLIDHIGVIFALLREREGGRTSAAVQEWCGRPATSVAAVLADEGDALGIPGAMSETTQGEKR